MYNRVADILNGHGFSNNDVLFYNNENIFFMYCEKTFENIYLQIVNS